jgi:NAD+ synthase
MINDIVRWIREYATNSNSVSLVVGVSGGIDSALVSTLCAMTGLKTFIISIPIKQKNDQLSRARNHANWLASKFDNVDFIEIDMTDSFETFINKFSEDQKTDLSLANTRSRIRMVTLYQISGSKNGIVVGTGNKIEDFGVGFFTKYGDGGVDISPIGNLTKSQVRNMAKDLSIAEEIILANPTDGLWEDDRTDEQQMGASYEELEWAMEHLESRGEIDIEITERQKNVLEIYKNLNRKNKHKMVQIPVFTTNNLRDN